QVEGDGLRLVDLRGATARDEQPFRLASPFSSQAARDFEADERPHAMAEKDERFVEMSGDGLGERFDEREETCKGGLLQLAPTARQLDRTYLDISREVIGPLAINLC